MRRCAQSGQLLTVASGKKFGTAKRHTSSAVRMMPSAFHRVKYNIGLTCQIQENAARERAINDQLADVSSLTGSLFSLAGSPLARTPEIICRIWRTRTPSEISNST